MVLSIRMGGKILWCGNGGSAADAQHLNGQLVVRFRLDRPGIPSIALSTDTSILTAASNNYGYEHIFQRQVETLARKGDVVVAISTSGNSRNVFLALEAARKIGAVTVAFTGQGGGKIATAADFLFEVPSADTPRIQEAHILAGHVLCEILEKELNTGQGNSYPRTVRESEILSRLVLSSRGLPSPESHFQPPVAGRASSGRTMPLPSLPVLQTQRRQRPPSASRSGPDPAFASVGIRSAVLGSP